jgi:hypothetical protein
MNPAAGRNKALNDSVAPRAIAQAQAVYQEQTGNRHCGRRHSRLDKGNNNPGITQRLQNALKVSKHRTTLNMIICADDFGLREDIDEAILELCGLGRLNAVSCMVQLARCDNGLMTRLLEHQSQVDIGLHLCLTDEGLPLSPATGVSISAHPSFGVLFRRALLGQLQAEQVSEQVSAQYELFFRKSGRKPDHIDGHLHAHQLPVVRRGLLDFVLSLPPESRPYIRNTHLSVSKIRRAGLPWIKAGLIGNLGGRMKKALVARQMPTNDKFAGIYDFADWRRYPELFPKFAACLDGPNDILVVHPGRNESWRQTEFQTLREVQLPDAGLNRFQRRPWPEITQPRSPKA